MYSKENPKSMKECDVMAMEVEFYETESGKTPVANFIDSLDRKSSAKVLRDLF